MHKLPKLLNSQFLQEVAPVELILEHAVTSTDEQLVCTMAMLCKDWRAATQRAAVGRLNVSLRFDRGWAPGADGLPSSNMRKLSSFSQWLPKHAQIVSKLEVRDNWKRAFATETQRRFSNEWLHNVAEPALGLALRGAAAATASHGAAQLQALGLQSYSSHGALDTSAVLDTLPASSLTELEVVSWDIRALASALPRLAKLQRLKARSLDTVSDRHIMAATLEAAYQLSALTSLDVDGVFSSDLGMLPVQLLRLVLQVQKQDQAVLVDLSHLTRLTSLDIDADPTVKGLTIPVQLVDLCTRGFDKHCASISSLQNLSSLQQLETFSIVGSMENAEDLLQLKHLANLQTLALEYDDMDPVVVASSAWPQLRQLKHIRLDFTCPVTASLDLVQKLSSATQLTRLDVNLRMFGGHQSKGQETPKVAICHELANLTMLQMLSFDCHDWRGGVCVELGCFQSDIYHLSRLTNLTKLELCSRRLLKGQGVFDDPDFAKLLLQLKHLEELCVPIKRDTLLPVVANLTNLKTLRCLEDLEDQHLSMLQCLLTALE